LCLYVKETCGECENGDISRSKLASLKDIWSNERVRRLYLLVRFLRIAFCGLLILAGCTGTGNLGDGSSVAGIIVEGVQNSDICTTPANANELVNQLLELINLERTSRGLQALTLDPLLCQIADQYACEMIEDCFFAHVHPQTGEGPGQRAIDEGYIFLAIGENLAGGQITPEQVVSDWMDSTQGHRENILAAQWQEAGIGISTGGEYGVYWVVEFGNPP